MSIVKMKRLQLLGLMKDRDQLLQDLMNLGTVEIISSDVLSDPDYAGLLFKSDSRLSDRKATQQQLTTALQILNQYAPYKAPMFQALRPVAHQAFYDDAVWNKTLATAKEIIKLKAKLEQGQGEKNRLQNVLAQLAPWQGLDVPLNTSGTEHVQVLLGTLSASTPLDVLQARLEQQAPEAVLYPVHTDKDLHYFMLIMHRAAASAALELLREAGYTRVAFDGYTGTAADNMARTTASLNALDADMAATAERITAFASERENLQLCIDRSAQEVQKEEAKEKLLSADQIFTLEGWTPVPDLEQTIQLLDSHCCAYELSDPDNPEEVPIKLKNRKLAEPLIAVTEMYSLPAYNGIDPNPLIMPFFTIFFGIMYGDLGYGLVILLLGILGSRFIKKKGTIKYMCSLLIFCGITTSIFGFLFGSFFGDSIAVVSKLLGVTPPNIWFLVNPMESPMVMLIGSIAVGVFQIIVGMAVKAYMLIRDGHFWDAVFDVGSWWLLFAGIALGALGITWYVCIAGVAALVLTQGREKPTIIGKFIGGLASLYDITSYLGDILSYSRLMALLLASSVVASVVNVLGSLSGSIVFFVIVFIAGHAFNMGINIIGTYVHSARLQYLEFFGKFYIDGGRPFQPLSYQTKYTEIVKEEN